MLDYPCIPQCVGASLLRNSLCISLFGNLVPLTESAADASWDLLVLVDLGPLPAVASIDDDLLLPKYVPSHVSARASSYYVAKFEWASHRKPCTNAMLQFLQDNMVQCAATCAIYFVTDDPEATERACSIVQDHSARCNLQLVPTAGTNRPQPQLVLAARSDVYKTDMCTQFVSKRSSWAAPAPVLPPGESAPVPLRAMASLKSLGIAAGSDGSGCPMGYQCPDAHSDEEREAGAVRAFALPHWRTQNKPKSRWALWRAAPPVEDHPPFAVPELFATDTSVLTAVRSFRAKMASRNGEVSDMLVAREWYRWGLLQRTRLGNTRLCLE
jgi:hypothetical protein